jgi:hypothetical protein
MYTNYGFLKELDIHEENPGLFNGVWGGSGKVRHLYNKFEYIS